MADTLADVVWLDENAISRLLGSATAIDALPFLGTFAKQAAVKKKGCGCGAGNRRKAADFATLKRLLAEMPSDKKVVLKQLLNAKQIKVRYELTGNNVERTF